MKLQIGRAYGAKVIALPLAIVALLLFGRALSGHCGIFREFQAALLSLQWLLLVCLAIWCGAFIFLTFSRADWPLIGLLLIGIAAYFIGYAASSREADTIILLAGVTLGRGARVFVGDEVTSLISKRGNKLETPYVVSYFLIGLVVLLTFSAWWHLNLAGTYHGPRWMGLWNNPNIYGMLMGAGVVLAAGLLLADRRWKMEDSNSNAEGRMQNAETTDAIGLLAANSKMEDGRWKMENEKQKAEPAFALLRRGKSGKRKLFWIGAALKSAICHPLSSILVLAIGMMAVGLVMSYSRGAWVATAIGLLYLAWSYGKLKWRWVVIGVGCVALGAGLLWGRTADDGPWYLKRLDFSRPSAQHRVSAWRGALQMMRDHPLGVGWNKAVGVYDKNYSPPEGGAEALTMNSYLMLGTELGLPGLICFAGYVGLCFRKSPRLNLAAGNAPSSWPSPPVGEKVSAGRMRGNPPDTSLDPCYESLRAACLAGALALVVAFWFDGGLFDLPTAAVFWILLELGSERQKLKTEMLKAETNLNLVAPSSGCGATSTPAATK